MLQLYTNIKERRCSLEMTQTELAHATGYADKSMIAKIEKGQVDLPLSKIIAFAKALSIRPSELMGWDDEEPEAPPAALAPDEQLLLDSYRSADDDHKRLAFLALGVDPVKAREGMMVSA